MLGLLICKLRGHRIDRHRVWHDRLNFRTSCRRCKTPLMRGLKGWRVFDSQRDADPNRDPHPRSSGAGQA